MSRSTRSAVEWVAVIVGALVVALVVKTFLIQAFYIPSESMVPTLEIGDRVLVNKLSYESGDVSRGDVVVFDRPGGPGADGIKDLIKRVVALPGETVEGRDSKVYVDGKPLDEELPARQGRDVRLRRRRPCRPGHVWVMGDNRGASDDSRRFKSIPETPSWAAPSSSSGRSPTCHPLGPPAPPSGPQSAAELTPWWAGWMSSTYARRLVGRSTPERRHRHRREPVERSPLASGEPS